MQSANGQIAKHLPQRFGGPEPPVAPDRNLNPLRAAQLPTWALTSPGTRLA